MSEDKLAKFLYKKFADENNLPGKVIQSFSDVVVGMVFAYAHNLNFKYTIIYITKDKKAALGKCVDDEETYVCLTARDIHEDGYHNIFIIEYPEDKYKPWHKLSKQNKHYWLEYARQITEENYDDS